jgi:hypothetical protein
MDRETVGLPSWPWSRKIQVREVTHVVAVRSRGELVRGTRIGWGLRLR